MNIKINLSSISVISGTTSILMSKFVREILWFEYSPASIADANNYVVLNNILNVKFLLGNITNVSYFLIYLCSTQTWVYLRPIGVVVFFKHWLWSSWPDDSFERLAWVFSVTMHLLLETIKIGEISEDRLYVLHDNMWEVCVAYMIVVFILFFGRLVFTPTSLAFRTPRMLGPFLVN